MSQGYFYSKDKGFTLIEIIVVVAIIGILTAILTANFSEARKTSKNKVIRTSLSEVQLAIEVYKAQNKRYPATLASLVPDYTAALPASSISGNSACDMAQYSTDASGSYYKLTASRCVVAVTSDKGVQPDDEFARCPSSCGTCGGSTSDAAYKISAPFYESMAIYSVGGECL